MTLLNLITDQFNLGFSALAVSAAALTGTPTPDLQVTVEPSQVSLDAINPESGELAGGLSFSLETTPPQTKTSNPSKPVSTPPDSPYEGVFDQYSAQFGVDKTVLKKIAWCESHYNAGSQSKSGAYGGMYQFSASTWASTRQAMGADPNPDLRFDANEAILTAAFKIAAGGIRAWPVCSR